MESSTTITAQGHRSPKWPLFIENNSEDGQVRDCLDERGEPKHNSYFSLFVFVKCVCVGVAFVNHCKGCDALFFTAAVCFHLSARQTSWTEVPCASASLQRLN